MKHSIYFIGGASASGKSTVARLLAAQEERSIVELDNFYDILESATQDESFLEKTTQKIALELVSQLLAANAFCIVEGGWIPPFEAKKLKDSSQDRFYPVYCGYLNGKAKDRLRKIRDGKSHWLTEKPPKVARAYLRDQLKRSHWYQKQCKKYDLPFFDFSNFGDGVTALSLDYCRWRQAAACSSTAAPALFYNAC